MTWMPLIQDHVVFSIVKWKTSCSWCWCPSIQCVQPVCSCIWLHNTPMDTTTIPSLQTHACMSCLLLHLVSPVIQWLSFSILVNQ
jgi:hypothetical protein